MQLPTIHLNGTSATGLIMNLADASEALDAAYEALKRTAPNGRDYYPQGPAALTQAEEEHRRRLLAVDSVKAEVDALIVAIDRMRTS